MDRQQDIHLADKEDYLSVKNDWKSGNYSDAIDAIESSQFDTKRLAEEVINNIEDVLTTLQENDDPSFATERIEFGDTIPSSLQVGKVFFLKDL